jgi:hypothetical protein
MTEPQPKMIWYLEYPPSPWMPPTLRRGVVAKETDTNYLLSDPPRRRIPKRNAILSKQDAKHSYLAALRKCRMKHKQVSAKIKRLS